MGGSFDPIHLGHLNLARDAFATGRFDEVWLVPTPQNPLKPPTLFSAEERLAMCARAVATLENPAILASDWDIRHRFHYTVDSLAALRAEHFHLTWIGGEDTFSGLRHWKQGVDVLRMVDWLLVPRLSSERRGLSREAVVASVSRELKVRLLELTPHVSWMEFEPIPISSTELRDAIQNYFRTGEKMASFRYLAKPTVKRIEEICAETR